MTSSPVNTETHETEYFLRPVPRNKGFVIRLTLTLTKMMSLQEMSDRIMEEKERLSLSTARSRGTSRAGSPRHGRSKSAVV